MAGSALHQEVQERVRKRNMPVSIALDLIDIPSNHPRKDFSGMAGLAESMLKYGQILPILVCHSDTPRRYLLIDGARRLIASQSLRWQTISGLIMPGQLNAEQLHGLAVSNLLTSKSLNPLEEVEAILRTLMISTGLPRNIVIDFIKAHANPGKLSPESTAIYRRSPHFKTVQDLFASIPHLNADQFVRRQIPLLWLPDGLKLALRDGTLSSAAAIAISKAPRSQQQELIERFKRQEITESELGPLIRLLKKKAIAVKGKPIGIDNVISERRRHMQILKQAANSDIYDDPELTEELNQLLNQVSELLSHRSQKAKEINASHIPALRGSQLNLLEV